MSNNGHEYTVSSLHATEAEAIAATRKAWPGAFVPEMLRDGENPDDYTSSHSVHDRGESKDALRWQAWSVARKRSLK